MKDIAVRKGRRHILSLVAEGEHERQDFKFQISDSRKIARSISAFANHSGGCLLIGVKDNGTVAGVRNDEDIYVVEQAAERYCSPPQHVEFEAYSVDSGVIVIKALISKADRRPVRVLEADGSLHAYFRVRDENISAHPLMVRSWQRDCDGGTLLSLGPTESAVLDILEQGGLTPRELAIRLHCSQSYADDLIVRMLSMSVLDFNYEHGTFRIIRNG